MNKKITTALLATVFSGTLVVGVANSAYAAPSCSSKMCTWSGKNYAGQKTTSGLHKGTCYLDVRVRSVEHKNDHKVRYYPDKNCASDTHYDSYWDFTNLDAQSGFAVHSYKRL
ncbi:peptidase inhibitor family I36 protein [Streptomyces sp. NPDC055189]